VGLGPRSLPPQRLPPPPRDAATPPPALSNAIEPTAARENSPCGPAAGRADHGRPSQTWCRPSREQPRAVMRQWPCLAARVTAMKMEEKIKARRRVGGARAQKLRPANRSRATARDTNQPGQSGNLREARPAWAKFLLAGHGLGGGGRRGRWPPLFREGGTTPEWAQACEAKGISLSRTGCTRRRPARCAWACQPRDTDQQQSAIIAPEPCAPWGGRRRPAAPLRR
jgi:hypothetical protein